MNRGGAAGAPRPIRQGLLGGSFDPVHVAHIALARDARRHLALDIVTLIPAARPWQRDALGADARQRLDMLRLAIDGEPGLEVSGVEIERGGPTYTIDTLRGLPAGRDYFWILGADQLENFCTWNEWEDIVARVHLAVAARPGSGMATPAALHSRLRALGRELHILPMPPVDLSATAVRERIAAGLDTEGMLHPGVAQYIQRYGLYRNTAA